MNLEQRLKVRPGACEEKYPRHPSSCAETLIDTPLSALRTYQALARCRSFTATACDQGLAQSAMSRHVAALEAQLGQTLVIRGHRQIQLSRFQHWMGGAGGGRVSGVCEP